ncbi:MAG: type II toxin-antitoxin system RelE/ParE family toxin [Deltaproteobacteria bacterium]|nr:type II toxin-antitoxin system RelE/ParE family toxin [Deltaproteobacteria bacterium]
MRYRVVIPPPIERLIASLPPALKSKIRAGLDDLAIDPYQGKALRDNLKGLYSLRVTRYRIVYSIHQHQIEVHVLAIGPRSKIYHDVEKWFE